MTRAEREARPAEGDACAVVPFGFPRGLFRLRRGVVPPRAAEQDSPGIQEQRKAWNAKSVLRDALRLVFVDESGVTTKMTRLYGRALRGERARDSAPHGHWGAKTVIGALFGDGRTASRPATNQRTARYSISMCGKCLSRSCAPETSS